jgi:formylglycine-generating enzyme required for sulfatase activity
MIVEVRCARCGRTYDAGAHSSCPLHATEGPRYEFCGSCGRIYDAAATEHCLYCKPLKSSRAPLQEVSTPSRPEVPEPAVRRGRKVQRLLALSIRIAIASALLAIFIWVQEVSKPTTSESRWIPDPAGSKEAPEARTPGVTRISESSFKDCEGCPEMVPVPPGSFLMGSQQDMSSFDKPQHEVRFAQPFAVGRFPLTFDEWDACVADGGCNRYRPADQGWGRGRRPAINVSWHDATSYLAWLSNKTGRPYRLLSEAEREYVTRAGTTTRYSWGNAIGRANANCKGCGSQWDGTQTAPVGSFKPNAFGVYDMHGNVWEWVEDCWNADYRGAPSDGTAWIAGNCRIRMVRGGSWLDAPVNADSYYRASYQADHRINFLGFRVALTHSR